MMDQDPIQYPITLQSSQSSHGSHTSLLTRVKNCNDFSRLKKGGLLLVML